MFLWCVSSSFFFALGSLLCNNSSCMYIYIYIMCSLSRTHTHTHTHAHAHAHAHAHTHTHTHTHTTHHTPDGVLSANTGLPSTECGSPPPSSSGHRPGPCLLGYWKSKLTLLSLALKLLQYLEDSLWPLSASCCLSHFGYGSLTVTYGEHSVCVCVCVCAMSE